MTETTPGYFIAGNTFTAPPLAPGLYVVATPIGNLRDITIRALETLAAASAILCEDTRMSARLLDHYGIKGRRIALHEHNERALADAIANLPERERLVLALYYDEELNLKEIGEVLGVSESRVSQLHSQCAARLRARLGQWRAH